MNTRGICVVLGLTILVACNHSTKVEKASIDPKLKDLLLINDSVFQQNSWYHFYHGLDTFFNLHTLAFADTGNELMMISKDDLPDKVFYDAYARFIIYNADSSKFIDLDSYNKGLERMKDGSIVMKGGEIESQTDVIDLKKKSRQRIFFTGPFSNIEQAIWVNDTLVALMGSEVDMRTSGSTLSSTPVASKQYLCLWLVNINTNQWKQFRYKYPPSVPIGTYTWSVRLKSVQKDVVEN